MTEIDGQRAPGRPTSLLSKRTERSPGRVLAAVLVYGVLICWVASLYIGVLVADGLSDTNTDLDWWAHVIAVTLIAVTVEPVRRWLRRAVDDLVYGHLDDAFDVLNRLNRQIDSATPPINPDGDPSIAQTIARTLNVPYVAIVDGETETSVVGRRPADRDLADVPLTYQGEVIGHMYVASRHPGTRLSNRDMSLLADLAHQLGVGMYAVRASLQVQASRAALVTAREEERRRIRRDLHDGLGPTLASMKLQISAVQRLLEPDPGRAAAMLEEVRSAMNETTADIRRLVYGLRPPLIDELGLIAALRNHPAAQATMELTVRPEVLPDLPAAVEVALYRIGSEAIHNAVRHSGGRHCEVTIGVQSNVVRMDISDDGRGLPERLVDGVGVSAMRERAAELGGSVNLANNDDRGTTVTTIVPLGSVPARPEGTS
jgi:two-component system NarL family sensor kinase